MRLDLTGSGSLGNGGRAGTFQVGLGKPGHGKAWQGMVPGKAGQGRAWLATALALGPGHTGLWVSGGGVGEAAKQCTGPTPTKTDWTHQMGMTQGHGRVGPCWACTSNCQGRKG